MSRLTEKEEGIFMEYACTDKSKVYIAKDFGISMDYIISIIDRGNQDLQECTCKGFYKPNNCPTHGNDHE